MEIVVMSTIAKKVVKSALPELFINHDVLIEGNRVPVKNVTFSDTKGDAGIKISSCVYAHIAQTEQVVEVVEIETTESEQTVSYIAHQKDARCAWWSMLLPADIELNGNRINAPYLRKGADLELKKGDMLIDSEAKHHSKNRGYNVVLVVCVDEDIRYIKPTALKKAYIKANGGQDLMHESGDVAGCVRMAVWLRRQPNLSEAVKLLQLCY